jgi:hypothetical protein
MEKNLKSKRRTGGNQVLNYCHSPECRALWGEALNVDEVDTEGRLEIDEVESGSETAEEE